MLLAGFTVRVWPVTTYSAYQLTYQIDVITEDIRLQKPPRGSPKRYRSRAREDIAVFASEGQFGDENLLTPLTFRVHITWALSGAGCKPLGCPVFDPRDKHNEVQTLNVYLKTGEFRILNIK